jgi:hypothetical protein
VDIDQTKLQLDLVRLKREFEKEEFVYLSKCILFLVEQEFKMELYALIATGVVYAWVLTNTSSVLPATNNTVVLSLRTLSLYAVWLPPLLIGAFMLRSVSLYTTLEMTYAYIKNIEKNALGRAGWQQFVVDYKRNAGPLGNLLRLSMIISWFLIFTATVIIAWLIAPINSTVLHSALSAQR